MVAMVTALKMAGLAWFKNIWLKGYKSLYMSLAHVH